MGMDLRLEKLALRLLCAGASRGAGRASLLASLRDYSWKSMLHRAIFSAIASIASDDPELLRQLLPAKLTRMGFPDVEWEELFAPLSISSEEAKESVRKLLEDA